MMESARSRVLLVQLWTPDRRWHDVGELIHHNEQTIFRTFEHYWQDPSRPVLGQRFEENGPDWVISSRMKLPTWFSHLLPEGYMRDLVSRHVGVHRDREFFLLERIGQNDLPGATRVLPQGSGADVPDTGSAYEDTEEDDDDPLLKFSLAGVQLKFSVYGDNQRGLTIPARSQAGNWIAKLPDSRPSFKHVPEAEHAAMQLARASGIETPELMLVEVDSIKNVPDWAKGDGGKALAVSRYDRTSDQGRVHAEELAQIMNVRATTFRGKYRSTNFETATAILGTVTGGTAVGEVIDRIVLNVLVGNGDAHIKNWSVVYPDGRMPTLSPVYDVLPTVLYMQDDDIGLNLNGSHSFTDVTAESFDRLAIRAGWERSHSRQRVSTMVNRVVDAWEVLRDLLSSQAYEQLTAHRDSLKLMAQHRE